MTNGNSGPLNDDHFVQITQAIDRIKYIEFEIDRAKRAQIDVSQAEERLKVAKNKLQLLKSVYFPGRA